MGMLLPLRSIWGSGVALGRGPGVGSMRGDPELRFEVWSHFGTQAWGLGGGSTVGLFWGPRVGVQYWTPCLGSQGWGPRVGPAGGTQGGIPIWDPDLWSPPGSGGIWPLFLGLPPSPSPPPNPAPPAARTGLGVPGLHPQREPPNARGLRGRGEFTRGGLTPAQRRPQDASLCLLGLCSFKYRPGFGGAGGGAKAGG